MSCYDVIWGLLYETSAFWTALLVQEQISRSPRISRCNAMKPLLEDKSISSLQRLRHGSSSRRSKPRHDKLHSDQTHSGQKLAETFEMEYWPNRENAIDEAMVKFKVRLGFNFQTIYAAEANKEGNWVRSDSITRFVSRFQIYTGRPQQGQKQGLGQRVVKELKVDLKEQNNHLYFNNFFQVISSWNSF